MMGLLRAIQIILWAVFVALIVVSFSVGIVQGLVATLQLVVIWIMCYGIQNKGA